MYKKFALEAPGERCSLILFVIRSRKEIRSQVHTAPFEITTLVYSIHSDI